MSHLRLVHQAPSAHRLDVRHDLHDKAARRAAGTLHSVAEALSGRDRATHDKAQCPCRECSMARHPSAG